MVGVPEAATYYLQLAGPGVVPVGPACQPQYTAAANPVPCLTQEGTEKSYALLKVCRQGGTWLA